MIQHNHLRIMQFTLAGVYFKKNKKKYDVLWRLWPYNVCRLWWLSPYDVCRLWRLSHYDVWCIIMYEYVTLWCLSLIGFVALWRLSLKRFKGMSLMMFVTVPLTLYPLLFKVATPIYDTIESRDCVARYPWHFFLQTIDQSTPHIHNAWLYPILFGVFD